MVGVKNTPNNRQARFLYVMLYMHLENKVFVASAMFLCPMLSVQADTYVGHAATMLLGHGQ